MRIVLILFISLCSQFLYAQNYKLTSSKTREVVVNYSDSIVKCHVLIVNKAIKLKEDVLYYWYYSNTLKSNIAGYEGNLLDGEYSMLSKDNCLLVKGTFKEGIKVNFWKYWYPNGKLKEIQNWEDGRLEGKCFIFDINGKKIVEANYKNGLLEGSYVQFSDGVKTTRKFSDGMEIIKPSKTKKAPADSLKSRKRFIFSFFNKSPNDSVDNSGEKKKFSSDKQIKELNDEEVKKSNISKQKSDKKGEPKNLDVKKSTEKRITHINATDVNQKQEKVSFWSKIFKKKAGAGTTVQSKPKDKK